MNYNSNDVPLPIADVGFSGAIRNRTRWDDNISWFDIPDKVLITVRFFGPLSVLHLHWFKTKNGKKFPSLCSAYDPLTQSFAQGKCPYEDDFVIPQLIMDAKKVNPLFDEENDPTLKEIKLLKSRTTGYGHILVRSANLSGGKPWQPIKIPTSVVFSLIRLKTMNRVTIQGKTYEADVADPYWGRDIHLMYSSTERNPNQKYMINIGDHTPLTELERSYLPQLYVWKDIVEFPSYEEVKQQLVVNGYYQMLNQLRGVASQDQKPQQFAYMEQYLPSVPKSPYGDIAQQQQQVPSMSQGMHYPQMPTNIPQQQQMPQQMTQQQMQQMQQMQHLQQMQMPQQTQQQQQQMQMPQVQNVPLPQNTMPQAPMPNMSMNMGNLQVADVPVASPIPFNVPPPQGLEPIDEGGDEYDIPFKSGGVAEQHQMPIPPQQVVQQQVTPQVMTGNPNGKTYTVRGKPNGVSASEFQQVLYDFGNNLARAKPFKSTDDSNLEGLDVLSCYGNYCGDLSCVKCPLRQFCLHV
jgi:hypothetical protein